MFNKVFIFKKSIATPIGGLLLMMLVVGMFYVPTESEAQGGMSIGNPSFEDYNDGNPAPWEALVEDMNYHVYPDSSNAHSGSNYLATNRRNSNGGDKSMHQDLAPPRANTTYRFGIWVRSSDGTGRQGEIAIWAHEGIHNGDDREVSMQAFDVSGTDWYCVETSLRVLKNRHGSLRLELYLLNQDSIDYYFDDATLRIGGGNICSDSPPPPAGNTKPSIPDFITPNNNASFNVGDSINFEWSQSQDDGLPSGSQVDYSMQIATDTSFANDKIIAGIGYWETGAGHGTPYHGTTFDWTPSQAGTYYWRVYAFDGELSSTWSGHRTFTVADDTCENASFTIHTNLKQQVNVTGSQLDDFIHSVHPNSPLIGLGDAWVQVGQQHNINAIYLMSHVIQEAGWMAASSVASVKNNIYSWGAYDHCPFSCALSYPTKAASIAETVPKIDRLYLIPGGKYYVEPTLAGMNQHYATDQNWKHGIASIMNRASNHIGDICNPNTNPTTDKFAIGDNVQTVRLSIYDPSGGLNVRPSPAGSPSLGRIAWNSHGVVLGGPQTAYLHPRTYTWWHVQWDNGLTGWSAEDYLQLSSGNTEPPSNVDTNAIVQAARNQIGVPYNSDGQFLNRHVYCGVWGPWEVRNTVCTDLTIDAYVLGTGGDGTGGHCGDSMWAAMGSTTGGINLEALVRADSRTNPGRYEWSSARGAEDMRRYFMYNQDYLPLSSDWHTGDVAIFDWHNDNDADHVGIISEVSNGRPTKMVHASGHSSCNYLACEVNWNSYHETHTIAHGRMRSLAERRLKQTDEDSTIKSVQFVLTTDNPSDSLAVYNSVGKYLNQNIDTNLFASSNNDFIPYIPYGQVTRVGTTQAITIYRNITDTYRIITTSPLSGNLILEVATMDDGIVQATREYTISSTPYVDWVTSITIDDNLGINEIYSRVEQQPFVENNIDIYAIASQAIQHTIILSTTDAYSLSATLSDLTSPTGEQFPSDYVSLEISELVVNQGNPVHISINISQDFPSESVAYFGNLQIVLNAADNVLTYLIPVKINIVYSEEEPEPPVDDGGGTMHPPTWATDWTATFAGGDQALCQHEPGWINTTLTVKPIPAGSKGYLQTDWYVVGDYPSTCPADDANCMDSHYQSQLIEGETTIQLRAWWPGIYAEDGVVENHFSANLLDENHHVIHGGIGQDFYWYPWVCNAPDPSPGSIKIVKESNPQTGQSFDFAGDLGTFSLYQGMAESFSDLTAGTYDVSESNRTLLATDDWSLLSVTCREQHGYHVPPQTNLANFSAMINMKSRQDLTCTFLNEKVYLEGDIYVIYLPSILR